MQLLQAELQQAGPEDRVQHVVEEGTWTEHCVQGPQLQLVVHT